MDNRLHVLTQKQLEEFGTLCVAAAGFGLESIAFKQQWEASEKEAKEAFESVRHVYVKSVEKI